MQKITLTLDVDELRDRLTIFADAAAAISAIDLDPAATQSVHEELAEGLIDTLRIENDAYGPESTPKTQHGYIITSRDAKTLWSFSVFDSEKQAEDRIAAHIFRYPEVKRQDVIIFPLTKGI